MIDRGGKRTSHTRRARMVLKDHDPRIEKPRAADASPQPSTVADPPYPSAPYAWYVVGVLMVVYVFSFMDRQIFSLLVDHIQGDLHISDLQFSYLMGLSFALFYTFFGIPLGRLADSTSRRGLIAVGLFFWSLMTAGCGFAVRYWQFLLLRMGVGVGEATLSPASYSLITDSFPTRRLATAISVYSMGIYIGSGMSYMAGGFVVSWVGERPTLALPLLGDIRAWQVVFLVLGIPGALLTLALLTVREPYRRGVTRRRVAGRDAVEQMPLKQVAAYMARSWRTIACHNVGFALLSFSSYGATAWIPAFFQRTYEWKAAEAGIVYGAIVAVFGPLGIVFGGWLADRLGQSGVSAAKMRVGLLAALIWAPTGLLYPLAPSAGLAMALLAPTVFFVAMPFGLSAAAIQEMMPPTMRAQASAVYLFVVNLIGLGIGPSAVAWVTDVVYADPKQLRYSLLTVCLFAHVAAGILLWLGIHPFKQSLVQLHEWTARQESN